MATVVGDTLRMRLSATQVRGSGADGEAVSGHLKGLALVCQGVEAASLAALPPLGEVLGRVAEGRLGVGGTWHRHWPVALAVPGPVHLQWHLANRTELTLACASLHLVDDAEAGGVAFFPSMAC